MDMKKTHVNFFFWYPCWWIREKSEVVIFEIVFGMVHGWPYERFQKRIPPYTGFEYSTLKLKYWFTQVFFPLTKKSQKTDTNFFQNIFYNKLYFINK
jgi:hypothetical protein